MESITNSSLITYDVYKKFYRFTLTKTRNPILCSSLICIALLFIFIALFFNQLHSGYSQGMTILMAMIVTYCMYIIYQLTYGPRKSYKKSEKFYENPFNFIFEENNFEVKSQNSLADVNASYRYGLVKKAYELNDAFYLFIDKKRAYIVLKNGFVNGTPEECRVLLKEKLDSLLMIRCK